MSRESFPELPAMPEVLAELPVSVLTALIARTVFAISTEESRFSLNGALLVVKERGLAMVSTDGHRLAYAETKQDIEGIRSTYRALVPRKAMGEILKLAQDSPADSKVSLAGDDNHLFFQFGERLLISRKLTGNFPDFERVLPKDHSQSVVLEREEVRAAVERVGQFADERSHAIRLQVCPGELKVHSSVSETGESEESISNSYDGPTVEVGFNAQYLLDFLRATSSPQTTLFFKDAQSAGEWRPTSDAEAYEYRYIVMPMRI
jgi:DNA polymerase-3 subunit beta